MTRLLCSRLFFKVALSACLVSGFYSAESLASPEKLIGEVLSALSNSDLASAEKGAQTIVERYPSFDLGYVLLGDILMLHSTPSALLVPEGKAEKADAETLQNLRAEAKARIAALLFRPPEGAIPSVWLHIAKAQKRVLIADTLRSRLWVYRNQNGRPVLEADYYMSQGRGGDKKKREGDLKTPLGIYHVVGSLHNLPDFYGVGALPINYPNEWDKHNQRTGSNIWLHGVPKTQYSRPPLASEGCLVFSNDDMNVLLNQSKGRRSGQSDLVIITDKLTFVPPDEARQLHQSFEQAFLRWSMQGKARAYPASYSKRRKVQGDKLRNVTLVRYPESAPIYLAEFEQVSKGKTVRRQQYWGWQNGEWRIQYEK